MNLNFLKKSQQTIVYEDDGLAQVYIQNGANLQKISEINPANYEQEMAALIQKHPELTKNKLYWLLNNEQYEIIHIEKTPLNKEETREYIKWKIKDSIELPIQDIVYDVLYNEHSEHPFLKKHLTVVAGFKQYIDKIISSNQKLKIPLQSINIPEFSLRTILKEYVNKANEPVACLQIASQKTHFLVYLDNSIVLRRTIERGYMSEDFTQESFVEKIVLELQRSVDFLDRQHSISAFNSICLFHPENCDTETLQEGIKQYFGDKFINIPINSIPLPVQGEFLRNNTNNGLEFINLYQINKDNDDAINFLKKTIMTGMIGMFFIAAIGSFIQFNYLKNKVQNEQLNSQINLLNKNIPEMQEKLKQAKPNSTLIEELASINQAKQELLAQQNIKNVLQYSDFLNYIAQEAINSNIRITQLELSYPSFKMEGETLNKDNVLHFIDNMKQHEIFHTQPISSFETKEQNDKVVFIINAGAK